MRGELIAGCILALAAAAIIVRLRSVATITYAGGWNHLHRLRGVPLSAVRSVFVVAAEIVRSLWDPHALKGHVEELPFEFGTSTDPNDAFRRARVTYGICVAPSTVVCIMDRGKLVQHRLVGRTRTARWDERWPV